MSIQTLAYLKSRFETGDFPTQQDFIDLIETLGLQNNLRTVEYTVGVPGITGVDYNFTSVGNATEQSIQLGGTTIIPADSIVIAGSPIIKCTEGLNGAITGTADIGTTAGGDQYIIAGNVDDTNEIIATGNVPNPISASASSVYFSFTPSANWNTITTGKWKIWITYLDNSLL